MRIDNESFEEELGEAADVGNEQQQWGNNNNERNNSTDNNDVNVFDYQVSSFDGQGDGAATAANAEQWEEDEMDLDEGRTAHAEYSK